jgi:four helix bundle protein
MSKPYDIRKRAELFSDDVFKFGCQLRARSARHVKLIDQLNDAAGSVGANLEEAQAAESKKDFIHKNSLALKEARESRYWLRVARGRERSLREFSEPLIDESEELVAIITAIIKKAKSNPYRGETPDGA